MHRSHGAVAVGRYYFSLLSVINKLSESDARFRTGKYSVQDLIVNLAAAGTCVCLVTIGTYLQWCVAFPLDARTPPDARIERVDIDKQ